MKNANRLTLNEMFFERMSKLHPENQIERADQAANLAIELMAEIWRFCNNFSMTDEEIEKSFNDYLATRFFQCSNESQSKCKHENKYIGDDWNLYCRNCKQLIP